MNITVKGISLAVLMLMMAGQSMADDGLGEGKKVRESIQIADHVSFSSMEKVTGATSLIRDQDNKVITTTVTNNDLEAGWAYSMWWVVYNQPQYCAVAWECSSADLEVNGGNPRILSSVFYAGGFIADGDGDASTSMRLTRGKTERELFAMSKPFGLLNLRDAEIHLVIRSHGVAGLWGDVSSQIGSSNEACPPAGCANEFFSVHRAK